MKQALMMVMALMLGIASQADAEEGSRYFEADTRVYGSCQVFTHTDKMGLKAPSVQMYCGDMRTDDAELGLRWRKPQGRLGIAIATHKRVPKISECIEPTGDCRVPVRFSQWSTGLNWVSDLQVAGPGKPSVYVLYGVGLVVAAAPNADYLHVAFGTWMLRIPLDGFTAAYADFSARLGQ